MKRFALFVTLLTVFGAVWAQSNKVVTAWNLMKPEYNELDKAKQAIDDAAQHPKTSTKAKTWFYRGLVYYKIYQSKDKKFKNLDPNPLKVAYQSFVKAKELDVKNRYTDKLIFRLTMSAAEFFNKGSKEFQQKKYDESLESFETALAIGRLPYINQLDTGAYFNAAIAADQAGKYDKAEKYYQKAIDYKYGGAGVYKYLADVYLAQGDSTAYIQTLKKGIDTYPDTSNNLVISLINYYLSIEQINEAYGFIEKALQKEGDNPSLWFVYGIALERNNKPDKAIEAYKKSVELNDKYFDGWFNLGTVYFNKGVKANDAAANIPLDDTEGYKKAVAKVDEYFKEALPYYEKAYELNPNDANLLTGLRTIYYRFKMNDKFKEIQKKIDELK